MHAPEEVDRAGEVASMFANDMPSLQDLLKKKYGVSFVCLSVWLRACACLWKFRERGLICAELLNHCCGMHGI